MKKRVLCIAFTMVIAFGMTFAGQNAVFATEDDQINNQETVADQGIVDNASNVGEDKDRAAEDENTGDAQTSGTDATTDEGDSNASVTVQAVDLDEIYIHQQGGDDNGTGAEGDPVKTLAKAIELAKENDTKTIIVRGTIDQINGTIDLEGISLERADGNTSSLISINSGKDVTLINGTIDGKDKDASGALVVVQYGGKFTLGHDGVLQGNGISVNSGSPQYGGGVRVYGEMILDGGTITRNAATYGGAIFLRGRNGSNAKLTINSGSIERNYANHGGGVFVWKEAECTMNAGKITGNNASDNGGGVATWDEWSSGTDDHKPYADPEYPNDYPAAFILNNGDITNNSARNGGGVYIASNNGRFIAGNISDNNASGLGGGIYVASVPYVAHIENALITDNTASNTGGGIWFCPTGDVTIVVNDGSAIYDNSATRAGDDLTTVRFSDNNFLATISDRMLGGGNNNWYRDGATVVNGSQYADVDGSVARYQEDADNEAISGVVGSDEQYSLKNHSSENARALAVKRHTLTITGNSAYNGGGVASNGGAIFGTVDTPTKVLNVKKIWDKADVKDAVIPESIEIELMISGVGIETVKLSEENNWSYSFKDLPLDAEATVKEVDVPGWTNKISETTADVDENNVINVDITITNIAIEETPDKPETPYKKPPVEKNKTPKKVANSAPPKSVKTGDMEMIEWMMLLAVAALVVCATLGIFAKRRRTQTNRVNR